MESARCKAFIASADEGSFTAAGKLLDYTPSGVSQLVRALEEELGLVLLTRKKSGVTLTREGQSIYSQISDYLKSEQALFDMANGIARLKTGSITIATFTSIAASVLPSLIKGFSESYKDIDIGLIEAPKSQIEDLLSSNKADIAFASSLDVSSYDFMPFMTDRMVAVLPEGHRLASASVYPLSECENDSIIMPANGNDIDVRDMFKLNGIKPHVRYSTIEDRTAVKMVSAGLGICISNETAVLPQLTSDLTVLPLDPGFDIEYGITAPAADFASPAVNKFVNYARSALHIAVQ